MHAVTVGPLIKIPHLLLWHNYYVDCKLYKSKPSQMGKNRFLLTSSSFSTPSIPVNWHGFMVAQSKEDPLVWQILSHQWCYGVNDEELALTSSFKLIMSWKVSSHVHKIKLKTTTTTTEQPFSAIGQQLQKWGLHYSPIFCQHLMLHTFYWNRKRCENKSKLTWSRVLFKNSMRLMRVAYGTSHLKSPQGPEAVAPLPGKSVLESVLTLWLTITAVIQGRRKGEGMVGCGSSLCSAIPMYCCSWAIILQSQVLQNLEELASVSYKLYKTGWTKHMAWKIVSCMLHRCRGTDR